MTTDPVPSASEQLEGGKLSAAISNAIVRLYRDYVGRGPTRVRTSMRDHLIIVMMEDTLTTAERTLVAGGEEQEVLRTRAQLHRAMQADLRGGVERLAGRTVVASMGTNHIDPDLACEIFVLEPVEPPLEGSDVYERP